MTPLAVLEKGKRPRVGCRECCSAPSSPSNLPPSCTPATSNEMALSSFA
jgi:hypothetical protein